MSTTVNLEVVHRPRERGFAISTGSSIYEDLIDETHSVIRNQLLGPRLSDESWRILQPHIVSAPSLLGELNHEYELDPRFFIRAVKELSDELINNAQLYPKEFRLNGQSQTFLLQTNNQKFYIEGFSNDTLFTSHIKVTWIHETDEVIHQMIPIESSQKQITIGGIDFEIAHYDIFERYKYDIDEIISTCNYAIKESLSVFWYISF